MSTKNTNISEHVVALAHPADASLVPTATSAAPKAPSAEPKGVDAVLTASRCATPPAIGCQQAITLNLFFDGTGNNLDADTPTAELSNVARLFNAHVDDDEITQVYKRYIPGVGTYFRDIGDPGGTTLGKGAGSYGDARLYWAFYELAKLLRDAEARAHNPSNRITQVKIGLIGFSRGAALTRAFANRLENKYCTESGGSYTLKANTYSRTDGPGYEGSIRLKGGYRISVYFMGIWDTVASVGLASATNNIAKDRKPGVQWRNLLNNPFSSLMSGMSAQERDLYQLAYKNNGADPSPAAISRADGHASWGGEMQITPITKVCHHLVAAHEIRNAFPLDSILIGTALPGKGSMFEAVLPGVHSDIGGGYREGEQGRSNVLATAALRMMHEAALEAHMPLEIFSAMTDPQLKQDFALPGSARHTPYQEMQAVKERAMQHVAKGNGIGGTILNHMRQYWLYRLSALYQRLLVKQKNQRTDKQTAITSAQKGFSEEKKKLEKDATAKKRAYYAKSYEYQRKYQQDPDGTYNEDPLPTEQQQELDALKNNWREAQAKVDTAADDGAFLETQEDTDTHLYHDAKKLYEWEKEGQKDGDTVLTMRPHYKAIVDAYTQVFINGKAWKTTDPRYRFYDNYIHDSLIGFKNQDNTRPSDPRMIYVGQDNKLKYANIQKTPHSHPHNRETNITHTHTHTTESILG